MTISPSATIDHSRRILRLRRKAPDQIAQTVSARSDMSAVLDAVWRPVAIRGARVTLVERCLERLEDKRFVVRSSRPSHFGIQTRDHLCIRSHIEFLFP
jgi:hypothetical protein